METKSLLGKWKLVKNGSDFLPGVDTLAEAPLVLRLLGNSDVEFYKIEKKKYIDIEEIQFTYVSKNTSVSKSYQLCTLNMDAPVNNDVNFAMVKSLTEDFTEVTIVRVGPKTGQMSQEHYKLDMGTGEIRLKVEVTTQDGTRFNLIKYLSRFDDSGDSDASPIFDLSTNTLGWSLFDIWPSTMLSNATISIVKVVKMRCQDGSSPAKIMDTPWTLPGINATAATFDFHAITRSIGNQPNDGEEVFMFVVKVSVGEASWHVAHRYREFDALRKFLLSQNPFVTAFQENDAKFPGKTLFHSHSVLEQRAKALNDFLSTYLTDARYCRQNSLDAICSFLQLPEHLYEVAKQKLLLAKEQAAMDQAEADNATSADDAGDGVVGPKISVQAFFDTAPASPPVAAPPAPPVPAARAVAAAPTPALAPAPVAAQPAPLPAAPVRRPPTINTAAGTSSSSIAQAPSPASTTSRVSVRNPALTPAHQRLLAAMGDKGLPVIKHGRQGAPKRRALFLSPDGAQLVIQAEDHYKTIKLVGVTAIRMGNEIDPATPAAALEKEKEREKADSEDAHRKTVRRTSLFRSSAVLYGTATLRRSCNPDKMSQCISLVLPTRTVDFECLSDDHLQLLRETLTDICLVNASA